MSTYGLTSLLRSAAIVLSVLALLTSPALAEPRAQGLIAPISGTPGGQTYGRWAAEWWQWALGVPEATNPLLDETGERCDQRQVDQVWFLAGTFGGPVQRECTVPAGRALFFPLINTAFVADLNDPEEERTEEFVRAQARCTAPVTLFAEIDGFEIRELRRFSTGEDGSQSPIFNIQLPPGAVFGFDEDNTPELLLSPVAEDGFYLFVKPLDPGEHMIRWSASGCLDPAFTQDVTYILTIVE